MFSNLKMSLGSELSPKTQTEALRLFINRYTGENCPKWVKQASQKPPVQFADDREWLANTYFHVTKTGDLSKKHRFCYSSPTWPYNPELRKPRV